MLREKQSILRVLLTEKALTFARAVEIAVAREAAEKDVKEFSNKSNSHREINAIKSSSKFGASTKFKSKQGEKGKSKESTSKPAKPCSGCGKNHWKSDCPFKNSECYLCKKIGHISKVCFTKKQTSNKVPAVSKNVGLVEVPVEDASNHESNEYIFSIQKANLREIDAPYLVNIRINNKVDMEFQLDSGAGQSLMSEGEYWRIFPEGTPPIRPYSIELNQYGGSKMPVRGNIQVDLSFRGKFVKDGNLVVVKDRVQTC